MATKSITHLADLGVDRADHAVGRCPQGRIRGLVGADVGKRRGLRVARLGGVELCAPALEFGRRDEPLPVQVLETLDVGALLVPFDQRGAQLRTGRGRREREVGRIEGGQHIATPDPLTEFDPPRTDAAGHLESEAALDARPHFAGQLGVGVDPANTV